jgi:hypothetical protein
VLDVNITGPTHFDDPRGWVRAKNGTRTDTNKDLKLNSGGDKTYEFSDPEPKQ